MKLAWALVASLVACVAVGAQMTMTGVRAGKNNSPIVTTTAATSVGQTTATLHGTANPKGLSTSALFQWGLTGSLGSSTTPQALGSGSIAVSIGGGSLSGLTCNTTYHFRATATNSAGTTNGQRLTFTTLPCSTPATPPTVVTNQPTGITETAGSLNGTVNPNGYATTAFYEWGLTTGYGSTTVLQSIGSGSTDVVLAVAALTGLVCNTQYHFRATATNAGGTVVGTDVVLQTSVCVVPPTAPTVVTTGSSGVTQTSASLSGTANPNGTATTAQFAWGASAGYGSLTAPQAIGTGASPIAIGGGTLTGLTCGTTYFFRATATNGGGTANGVGSTFTTSACTLVPTVVTTVVTSITQTSAVLNGTVNPQNASTTAFYEWGTSTAYGTTTTSQAMGSGGSVVSMAGTAISGLICNTTYHYRAKATNSVGTSVGGDVAFQSSPCSTGIVTAVDCQRDSVNTAINTANNGDTVIIPAGTCTWTTALTITNKAVTIQGSGVDVTTIIDGTPKGLPYTSSMMFVWTLRATTDLHRITNLTINGGTGDAEPYNSGIMRIYGSNAVNFRMDHFKLVTTRTAGIELFNTLGVIDHGQFILGNSGVPGGNKFGIYAFNNSWQGIGDFGDNSWAQATNLGTAQFLFIEDCTFASATLSHSYAVDGWNGQRVVYRHNTFTNAGWANHGTETGGRYRSARAFEIYDNTFICNTSNVVITSMIGTRGGVGVAYNNALTATNGCYITNFIDLAVLRANQAYAPWGKCDGTSVWDQNSAGQNGYRCLDQPGVGPGTLLSGFDPTPVGWPNEGSEPNYLWNNTRNGALDPAVSRNSQVQLNRDFFLTAMPGYTPYVYPHPLVSGVGAIYYVSPTGTNTNAGTLASPWSLAYALAGAAGTLVSDALVYLRGGTYAGHFQPTVAGTTGHPITFRNYPGERAIIDGNYSTTNTTTLPADAVNHEVDTTVTVANGTALLAGITTVIDGGTTNLETVDTTAITGNVLSIHRYCPCPAHTTGTAVWTTLVAMITLTAAAHDLTFWGLEVTDSGTDDRTKAANGQAFPADDDALIYRVIRRRGGIDTHAPRTTLVNNVIHDTFQGLGAWEEAINSEYWGNVYYNNGMLATDRGHGHGIYTQNAAPSTKLFDGNVSFNNFGYAWQQYGSSSAHLDNYTWNHPISFAKPSSPTITPSVNLGVLWGGNVPINTLTISNGTFYRSGFALGYGATNTGITIANNLVRDRFTLQLSRNVTATNNIVAAIPGSGTVDISLIFNATSQVVPTDYTFAGNTWYASNTDPMLGAGYFAAVSSWAGHPCGYVWYATTAAGYGYCPEAQAWQQTLGYDLTGSTFSTSAPTGTTIRQFADGKDVTRHTVSVLNWSLGSTVSVDVSSYGWAVGQGYRWRNVANYYTDTSTGTYAGGGTITLPMTGHSVAVPLGYGQALGGDTFPEFGTFIVETLTP